MSLVDIMSSTKHSHDVSLFEEVRFKEPVECVSMFLRLVFKQFMLDPGLVSMPASGTARLVLRATKPVLPRRYLRSRILEFSRLRTLAYTTEQYVRTTSAEPSMDRSTSMYSNVFGPKVRHENLGK